MSRSVTFAAYNHRDIFLVVFIFLGKLDWCLWLYYRISNRFASSFGFNISCIETATIADFNFSNNFTTTEMDPEANHTKTKHVQMLKISSCEM